MAGTSTHPAFVRHHHRDGFVNHFHFRHGFFLGLNKCAALIGKGFGVRLDFFHHQAAQRCGAAQNVFQLALLFAQFFELLLDLDSFQTRQLAQADVQNIVGLAL